MKWLNIEASANQQPTPKVHPRPKRRNRTNFSWRHEVPGLQKLNEEWSSAFTRGISVASKIWGSKLSVSPSLSEYKSLVLLKGWKHICTLMPSLNKEVLFVDEFGLPCRPTLQTEVEKVFRSFILSSWVESRQLRIKRWCCFTLAGCLNGQVFANTFTKATFDADDITILKLKLVAQVAKSTDSLKDY